MPNLYSSMLASANPSQVEGMSRFFKTGPGQYGEGDKFLGIKVPVTRSIVKACWKTTGFEELERCIGSEYHELRLAALLCLVEIFSHAKTEPERQRYLKGEVCGWGGKLPRKSMRAPVGRKGSKG